MNLIKKCSIGIIYVTAVIFLTFAMSYINNIKTNAQEITLPARYRHTWHRTQRVLHSKNRVHYICKFRKHYAYCTMFYDSEKLKKIDIRNLDIQTEKIIFIL